MADWFLLTKWQLDLWQLTLSSFEFSSTRHITCNLLPSNLVIEKIMDYCSTTFKKNILIFHLKKTQDGFVHSWIHTRKSVKLVVGCTNSNLRLQVYKAVIFFLILKKQNLLIGRLKKLKKKMKLNLFIGVTEIGLIKWLNIWFSCDFSLICKFSCK